MTDTEYDKLRARIEDRYHQDLAALDRVRSLFNDDLAKPAVEPESIKRGGRKTKLSRSEAMKASWARRHRGKQIGDAKGISQKAFSKFLVTGPIATLANGYK